MSGPIVHALIAHLDSVFAGPNGDYPAVLEALAGVSAAQALWKPAAAAPASRGRTRGQAPGGNSIWQIVEHLTASKEWQIEMLEKGLAASPAWTRPGGDEEAWRAAVVRLQDAHTRLKAALEKLSDGDLLTAQPAEGNRTLLELILSSSSAHEAHHGGQIDYLKGLQAG